MEKQERIDDYWDMEEKLKKIAKEQKLSLKEFMSNFKNLPINVIELATPLLRKQLVHLEHMRQWELDKEGNNIISLPIFRKKYE